jgi:hypothetical protein
MKELVFFLEEKSAQAMLEGFLPRALAGKWEVTHRATYVVFEGKRDLESKLGKKLNKWLNPNSYFIIIRDTDSGDCVKILDNLKSICQRSGKINFLIRLAIKELESWYFGDLAGVEKGLGVANLVKYQVKKKYRDPDAISSPSNELRKITNGEYQKVSGSRKIGQHLSINQNRSGSYNRFLTGIRAIT